MSNVGGVVESADDGDQQATTESGPVAKGFGFLMVFAVLALAVLVLYRIYPPHVHEKSNPGFIDNIFGSDLVVFASRVVLLSAGGVLAVAAVFIVISFWKRGKAGHWMSRFGPFETQAVENLEGVVEQWQQWWQEEYQRATELEERVEQSDLLLDELNNNYQAALGEIARLQGNEADGDS
jgi:hypothetical protein